MISLRFGIKLWGSNIVRDWFRDLGFQMIERELVRETEWFEGYEVDDSSVFELFYL